MQFSHQPSQPVPIETKEHITTESRLLGFFELASDLYSTPKKAMLIVGIGDGHSALTASRKWDSAVSASMHGTRGAQWAAKSLLSIFSSHESIPAVASSFASAARKHSFLLWLMRASKWEVLLALELTAVVSPHLPPGKEQKQCCALCWARCDEKRGATPAPALRQGPYLCTAAGLHGRVPSLCGLGASTMARAERLLPERWRDWGNPASLPPTWVTPSKAHRCQEHPGRRAWTGFGRQQQQMQQLPSAAGFKGLWRKEAVTPRQALYAGEMEFKATSLGARHREGALRSECI